MIHVIKNSLIDYPGKIAAVLGLPGCNLRCPYCQNPELALAEFPRSTTPFFPIYKWWDFRKILSKGFVDAVVFSGGEPTLHNDGLVHTRHGIHIFNMCREIKKYHNFPIKIDTNGTRPDVISELIERELIDYVALSIKENDADFYEDSATIRSIACLRDSAIEFEIRIVAVSQKMILSYTPFSAWLKEVSGILWKMGIPKLKLHRHNKSAKILQPAFYDGVKLYDESDYQRLAEIVRGQGLECEVV